ncbi:S-layer homology domain-containing protein [Solibacillus silvestris]|uniref:S-layer homology domain-containing protein n=1 Tax=Solibacillus silvestris TaxID=76853 RepID=UPI003F7E06EA
METYKERKSWWQKALPTALSFMLVASSLSAAPAREVKAAANTLAPGGVSNGLISWVDVERSAEIDGNNVTALTDLADNKPWEKENDISYNANGMNFNGGIQTEKVMYTRELADFNKNDLAREVFSVQASKNYSGFPWELGGKGSTAIYGRNNSITTYFGRDRNIEIDVGNYDLKDGAMLNIWSAQNDWRLSLNGKKLHETIENTPNFETSTSGSRYYIGAGHSSRFNGMIAEVILFNRKLDDDERMKVNSYLALKYGLTLDTDYVASDGSTKMWSEELNGGYGNRITGIGRDEDGALNQKQSKAQILNANITIALGSEIKAANAENRNVIANNKSFFVFSDNGGEVNFSTPIQKNQEKLKRIERVYKVQKTSWQDTDITLAVDKVENATGYPMYLVVSSDDQFNESDSFYDLIDGKVTLNSGQLADGAYFTIAAPVPEIQNAKLEQAAAEGNQITLTFNKAVDLTDGDGFTVKVDGQEITLDANAITVDPNDQTKLIITLPPSTDVSNKEITVDYDANQGNLKGTNGVAVENFNKTIDNKQLALNVEKPAGDTVTTARPEFSGTATPHATVTVKISSDITLQVTADSEGKWSITPDADLPDGDYDIEIIATKDGKSSETVSKSLKVDTVTPVSYENAFTITKPDEVTNFSRPTISGTVETSTTTPSTVSIELKDANGNIVATADSASVTVNTDGTWSFTPPANLPDGEYTITATATDGTNTATKTHTFTIATAQAVNKTALQNKADEHLNLNAGNYTPYTWLNYNTALQQAQNVLANPNATQAEVDQALTELTAAQNALVLVVLPGRGLISLIPSTGSLSPNFQTDVTDYTMYVGNSTAVIGFGALPVESGATVSTTVNGQPGTLGQIPLQVGANAIEVTVTDANGFVKRYTITVYRDAYTDGGTWTPAPAPTPTPAPAPEQPQNNKTIIRVDLEVDGENPLEKTTVEIERTSHSNGEVTDFVNLTAEQAFEAVEKAKQIGNTIARIVIPDAQDIVDQVNVEVPKEALRILRDNGLDLEISTDNAHIAIPNSSMDGVEDNFYFRLIPVKKESERQAIEERARIETVVQETLQSDNVNVVARPMTIETNLPSRPVAVTLPLRGVTLPTAEADRQAYLNSLAVFIEHSDGEKKVVHPKVVTMQDGDIGLRFTVEKFSTFTIIQVKEEVHSHTPYIRGFEDGTFRPEDNITRAQAARMIARILGYEEGTKANAAPFKDIPNTHFAAGEIAFVKSAGIMDGDENGNFNATNNITRAQMAKVVANFKKLAVEENAAITFTDTKGHWAQWIIEANRDAGIISGYPDGRFAPNEAITRVQAVRMMNRMLERGPLYGVPNESFSDVPKTHRAFNDIEEAARAHSYSIDGNQQEQFIK